MTEASVEAEFEGLEVDAPLRRHRHGLQERHARMEAAAKELDERGIRHEVRVMSAHRDPDDGRRLRQERASCAACA